MKISVIIPVYNAAAYLQECLGSVLAAQAQVKSKSVKCKSIEVEIICVDDGSTDGSGEILEEWVREAAARESTRRTGVEAPRVTAAGTVYAVVHQANAGAAAARNAGIDAATGDWLVFVDGDDVIAPEFLAEVARHAEDADLIRFRLATFSGEEDFRQNPSTRPFPFGWTACAYHRKVVPQAGFRPYVCGEDSLFLLECHQRAERVVDVDRIVYGYRQHADSAVSSAPTMRRYRDRLEYGIAWLETVKGGGRGWASRREVDKACRLIVRDVMGSLAIETRVMDPHPWDEWYVALDRMLKTGMLPWGYAALAWICKTFRWHGLARLVRT